MTRDEIMACTDGRVLDREWGKLTGLNKHIARHWKYCPEYHASLDLIHKEEKWLFGQRQEIKIEYGLNLLDLLVPNKFLLLNDEDVMLYQVDLPDIINADAMTRLKALILTMKEDR